ncbi:MAG: glutaredoxin family protein [Bacteroidota bacterium]
MFQNFFRRAPDLSDIELLVISRDDCHLCDKALAVVEEVRRRRPFRLRVVKMVEGDEWHERYWDKIPVGLVNGAMIFKYRVTAEELLAKLRVRATAP